MESKISTPRKRFCTQGSAWWISNISKILIFQHNLERYEKLSDIGSFRIIKY